MGNRYITIWVNSFQLKISIINKLDPKIFYIHFIRKLKNKLNEVILLIKNTLCLLLILPTA